MALCVDEVLQRSAFDHIVYISSDAVYADSKSLLTEASCAQPSSLHGAMHLAREIMIANAAHGPVCFLRPTLIYGSSDPHNGYGPNRFIRLAKEKKDITVFGEGEELRDHVWIDDVAELACQIILRRSAGTLNIATGEVVSFRAIAERVVSIIDRRLNVIGSPRSGPMPHNGYRGFDNSATRRAFPEFRYSPILERLDTVIANWDIEKQHG
jgi:nucleoside-diphosphate-sugar epimerase